MWPDGRGNETIHLTENALELSELKGERSDGGMSCGLDICCFLVGLRFESAKTVGVRCISYVSCRTDKNPWSVEKEDGVSFRGWNTGTVGFNEQVCPLGKGFEPEEEDEKMPLVVR